MAVGSFTHLGVKLVDAANSLLHSAILDSLADLHPLLDHVLVDGRRDTSLAGKLYCRVREALDDKVVKDQRIEVTVLSASQPQNRKQGWIRDASIDSILK